MFYIFGIGTLQNKIGKKLPEKMTVRKIKPVTGKNYLRR